MPKKRSNAWSLRKKQKQLTTARLIEISLKVDEYVYNRKPISNTEAEQLIEEVESYKTTCIRDERSLQVIEKLTRCMKAIILEQEQSDNDNIDDGDICNLGENRPASVSPVYSMCDDDRTQFSQTVDATGANEGDEVIDLCIDDDDDKNSTNTASEDFIRPCPVAVEVDIHRAVSNLSLQEVPILEPDTCSQSILNNFDDQMQPNTPAKAFLNSSIGNDDRKGKTTNGRNHLSDIVSKKVIKVPALIIRPSQMFKPVTTKNLEASIVKLQGDSRVLKPVLYNTFNVKNTKPAKLPLHAFPINVLVHQERTMQGGNNKSTVEKLKENYSHPILSQNCVAEVTNSTNTNEHFNPNNSRQHDSNSVLTNKTNKVVDKDKQVKNTSSIPLNTTETKKKRAPRKKKNVETKENKTKKSPVKKKSNAKSKLPSSEPQQISFDSANINPKIPIYNDRVINDLSWMENIRFVREIRPDENDQTLNLEESFWDNYHLPASWNDNEFL